MAETICLINPPSAFLIDSRRCPMWSDDEKAILRANVNLVRYAELAKMLPGRTIDAIKQRATLMKLTRNCVRGKPITRNLDDNYFSDKSLQSAYWAGFLAADGCISTMPRYSIRLSLSNKDEERVLAFAKDCGYDGPVCERDSGDMRVVHICAAYKWHDDLKELYNIEPCKARRQPPNVTGDMALAYSIGYIDGDGCWAYQNKSKGYKMLVVVGPKPIVEWLQSVWVQVGIEIGKLSITFKRGTYRLAICGSKADLLAEKLGKIEVHKLERKWRVARGEAFGQERRKMER